MTVEELVARLALAEERIARLEERNTRLERWYAHHLETDASHAQTEKALNGQAKYSAEIYAKEIEAQSKEVVEVLHLKPEIRV